MVDLQNCQKGRTEEFNFLKGANVVCLKILEEIIVNTLLHIIHKYYMIKKETDKKIRVIL